MHKHADRQNIFDNSMIGFRAHVSTQELMIQLQADIIAPKNCVRAILALDVKQAFDKVKHAAILKAITCYGFGIETFRYVLNVLRGKEALFDLGMAKSTIFRLGDRGTPQGAVLSPFVFDLVIAGLPQSLKAVQGIRFSVCADDVTIGHPVGCWGPTKCALQQVADTVIAYAGSIGLECSTAKLELLVRGRRYISSLRRDDTGEINVELINRVPIAAYNCAGIHGLTAKETLISRTLCSAKFVESQALLRE